MNYIFDLDGTLLDTLADLRASCNYALAAHGYPVRTLDEVRAFVGNGVGKLIERALPADASEQTRAEVLATFKAHYLEHGLDTTRPYDGVVELLRQLRARGCKTAVVSNKFDPAVKELCEHFFAGLTDAAVGESAATRRKPAPDMVLAAMREIGVTPANAVYVGDSDVDLLTARNSGLRCISVLWGFRTRAFLIQHGATCFVERPEEILALPL